MTRGRGGRSPRGGQRGGRGPRANKGRVAAARALLAIEDGGHAEDVLSVNLPEGADGRLAWHLVFGVLRHRAQVDAALRPFLKQPLATLDTPVRCVLRLGAFEKLFSRTPDHAAVSQGVQVAKDVGVARASGLVNAVLRRVKPAESLTRAEKLDHPAWLIARWDQRYGEEETTAWCELNRTIPGRCVVLPRETLEEEPGETAAPLATYDGQTLARTRQIPADADLEQYLFQGCWVQDPAAILVADRFAEAVGQGRVLDACAAPGGKSFRLWSHGLDVVAVDREHRLDRLREGAERTGATITIQPGDWLEMPPKLGAFDGVLVDAPCTGLGTLRRHPEIRWRRHLTDLAPSAELQHGILRKTAEAVRPGGVLGYAVCSAEPEEGQEVVDRFLTEGDFSLTSTWSSAPPIGDADAHQLFIMRREGTP